MGFSVDHLFKFSYIGSMKNINRIDFVKNGAPPNIKDLINKDSCLVNC